MASRQPFRRDLFRRTPSGRFPATRYKLYLHRTTGQELMFVVRAVMDLTRYGNAEAEFRMWEAYHRGRSVVLVTHLERAELYAEQFAGRGLSVSIEPE